MKKDLRVRFEDIDCIMPGLAKQPDFFVELLSQKYNVIVLTGGTEEPDVLFYSCWGTNNVKWTQCIRIYYTAERFFPDFNMCDYAIGLANMGTCERFFRFPHYVFYNDILRKYENRQQNIDISQMLNRDFCSTVVSDALRSPIFFDFFNKLNEYKPIASGGHWNNNVGGAVSNKLDFIKNYKFHIAFENVKADDYVTEKIMESFVARTIPIYWGSNSVKKDFGEGGYINISDFDTLDRAIDYIKKVDKDNHLYMQMLCHGAQISNTYEEWCERLLNFLYNAIESGDRIFNKRLNWVYQEKHTYHRIRTSFIGQMYRKYKRTQYYIQKLWRKRIQKITRS